MLDSIATAPGGGAATANVVLFAAAAPLYWRANLPAIPLIQGQKRPAIGGWQRFGHRMPTELEQAAWLRQFSRGNIGLPPGRRRDRVRRHRHREPGPPPCHRGRAAALALAPVRCQGRHPGYRFGDEATTRIKDADGKTLVEILSTGTQAVMPPSIHPATLTPYVSNTNLWEAKVLDELEPLPPDFEGLLRAALTEAGAVLGGGTGKGSGLPRPEPVRGAGGQRIDGREGWLRDEVWKLVHDPEITSEEQLLERAVEAFDRECVWGATALSATA